MVGLVECNLNCAMEHTFVSSFLLYFLYFNISYQDLPMLCAGLWKNASKCTVSAGFLEWSTYKQAESLKHVAISVHNIFYIMSESVKPVLYRSPIFEGCCNN